MTDNNLITIQFHEASLIVRRGETPETTLVAMKPVVEGMGLDWATQFTKLKAHPVLSQGIGEFPIPSAGGLQMATALPLNRIHFWLATIQPNKVPDVETRQRVILFQTDAADALFNHFFGRRFTSNPIQLPNFSDPVAAARAWADAYEAKQVAEQRALTAEQTKAEIGSRREATAMNTASQAVKKANRLEVELDRSHAYASIKRMSMLYHGQDFNWRLLKRTSVEMSIPAIDVFDQNYGTVKAYHADVWHEAYALDIPGRIEGEAA